MTMTYADLVKRVHAWLGDSSEPDDGDDDEWFGRMEIRVDGALEWQGTDQAECNMKLGEIVRFHVSGPTARSVIVGQHSFESGPREMTWVWEIQTAGGG